MYTRILLALLLTTGLASAPATRERGKFSLQGDPATLLAIDPQVNFVLFGFSTGHVCVFPGDQRVVQVFTCLIHKKALTGAVFLPDTKSLVTASADGTLRRWAVADLRKHHKAMEDSNGEAKPELPKPEKSVSAHSGYGVTCLAVNPDGDRLATGATDGTVKLWDAETLKQLVSLAGAHPGGVKSVQFSPDGKTLASGGADKSAKLWDATAAKPTMTHKLEGHAGTVNAVAFSPDGKQLAAGTGVLKKAGMIHVWNAETGKTAYKLEGHEDVVTCLVFHPKTSHLASGGADKMIRVWELKEKVQQYEDAHSEALRSLVISADGVRFGSCSDRSVRWWAGFGK